MRYVFKNFVWSYLSEEALETDTVLSVEDTSRFPALTSEDVFMCALHDGEQEPELVKMVLVGTETLTVVRAQEETTAKIWPKGTKIFNSVTAAMFDLVGYPATLAENVEFTPVGDIAATTVQDAIAELAADVDATEASLLLTQTDVAAIQAFLLTLDTLYAPLVHTHPSTDITDFSEAVDDRVGMLLQEGSNVTLVYDDALGTLTIHSSGGSGVSDGDKGDITVASGGTVWTINSGAIAVAEVSGLVAALAAKSDVGHDHDADYAALGHDHDADYSPLGHNHDASYSPLGHDHDADYAALAHGHAQSDVTNLVTDLAAKQPLDATLTAWAAVVGAANKLAYFTALDTFALTDFSAYARTLLDDADAGTAQTTLGISTFVKTILDDADGPAVRTTIGALASTDTSIGKQSKWIGAAEWTPCLNGGISPARSVSQNANLFIDELLLFDGATAEYAVFDWVPPKKWDGGTITFMPYWQAAAGTATQTCIFGLAGVCIGNNESPNAAPGTAQTSSDALDALNVQEIGPESSAITLAGTPADTERVRLRVYRDAATDTLTGDVGFIGMMIFFTTSAGTDA